MGGIGDAQISGFPWVWSTLAGFALYWVANNPWENSVKGNTFITTAQDGTSMMWLRTYDNNSNESLLTTDQFNNSGYTLAISGTGIIEP